MSRNLHLTRVFAAPVMVAAIVAAIWSISPATEKTFETVASTGQPEPEAESSTEENTSDYEPEVAVPTGQSEPEAESPTEEGTPDHEPEVAVPTGQSESEAESSTEEGTPDHEPEVAVPTGQSESEAESPTEEGTLDHEPEAAVSTGQSESEAESPTEEGTPDHEPEAAVPTGQSESEAESPTEEDAPDHEPEAAVSTGQSEPEAESPTEEDRSGYAPKDSSNNGEPDKSAGFDKWQMLLTLLSVITALVATTVSFWLYYWRKKFIAEPDIKTLALVPERWSLALSNFQKVFSGSQNSFKQQEQKLQEMIETFMTFHKSLDEKDQEIRRLREGYNTQIHKKFVNRFLRVNRHVKKCLDDRNISEEEMEKIKTLLKDALEECDIEEFSPDIGADYRKLGEMVSDDSETVETDDPDKDFTVAEIIEPGYRVTGAEREVVVRAATVKIYKTKK